MVTAWVRSTVRGLFVCAAIVLAHGVIALDMARAMDPPMPILSPARTATPSATDQLPIPGEQAAGETVSQALPFAEEPMALRPTDGGDGSDSSAEMLTYPGSDPAGEGDISDGDTANPPPAAAPLPPPGEIRPGTFTLEARLTPDGAPLGDGVKWRIFGNAPGGDGRLPMLGQADGGRIFIRLEPGTYYVHVAYGRAGATRKVEVKEATGGQVFVLNAGGMRLLAMNAGDQTLTATDVTFDIYAPDEGGSDERYLLISNAPPGRVIALNAGTYHVVCKYGDANAVIRADVRIDPGKLTETTLFQKGARLTLKLVEQRGGEALADTAWSVVTPGGENVVESVGAFPSVVLAEGDYTAIAKHDGRIFQANFSVVAGLNRDIEVLAQ